MVERLRSISNRTPWSLLLKSGALILLWLWAPFWFFAVLSLIVYSFPIFRAKTLLPEFLLLLFLSWNFQGEGWAGLILWFLFVLLFGMKEFIIVDRARSYEAFSFFALFLAVAAFYGSTAGSSWRGLTPFLLAGSLGLVSTVLFRRMPFEEELSRPSGLAAALGGFFVWQLAFLMLFLPLNFFEGTAILFMFIAGFTIALTSWRRGEDDKRLVFSSFALFAASVILVLAMAPWQV